MTRRKSEPSASTGVMSLKTMPFFGKSGMSRMRERSSFIMAREDITRARPGRGPARHAAASREVEERVPRARPLTHLEVQVRSGRATRLAHPRDRLPRVHALALPDQDRA